MPQMPGTGSPRHPWAATEAVHARSRFPGRWDTSPSRGRLIEDPRRRPDTVNYPDGACCVRDPPQRAAGELRAHARMSGIATFRRDATLAQFVALFRNLDSLRPKRVAQAGNRVTRVGKNRYPTPNIRCTTQNICCTDPERLGRRVPATKGRRTEAISLQAAGALRRSLCLAPTSATAVHPGAAAASRSRSP